MQRPRWWVPRPVTATYVAVVVALASYVVSLLPGVRPPGVTYVPALDLWVGNGVAFAAAALCVSRAVLVPAQRLPWAMFAAACLSFIAGTSYYYVVLADLPATEIPFPSLADAGWLSAYLFLGVGLLSLLRAQLTGVRGTLWLDGLTGGAGAAALAGALVLNPVLALGDGDVLAVLTNLAYPVLDLGLLTMVVLGFTLQGWRVGPTWWLLGLGLALLMVCDTTFLLQVAAGTFEDGSVLNAGWPTAYALVAGAAWLERPTRRPVREWTTTLAVPVVLSLAGAGVLFVGATRSFPVVTAVFGLLAVVLATARLLLTLVETRRLADARREARTDELTGLPNRRRFLEVLTRTLDAGRPATVLVTDLDGFKQVNDSLGHGVGDLLLQSIGARLQRLTTGSVLVARLGGDEFAALLPDADTGEGVAFGHRVRAAISEPLELAGMTLSLGASIGVASSPQHGKNWDGVLSRADAAMYEAKRGRTGVEAYVESREEHALERLSLLAELRTALRERTLELHYQPLFALSDGSVHSAEALVRWQHPTRGLLAPVEFLPVAVEAGLSRDLTDEVLRLAVDQAARWRAGGAAVPVAVNLTAADLTDPTLPERVTAACAVADLPASLLKLEVTETLAAADADAALAVLRRLRELGHPLSLDDFGTGYSSLSYLRRLPVDEVKLDRSFLHGLSEDPAAAAVVLATVELARILGLAIVAEGVEDASTLVVLTELGCDVAQGYYLQRPVPADAMDDVLATRRQLTAVVG